MALSGSGETAFAQHRLLIEWNASQNVSGNFSTVNVFIYLQSLTAYGAINASTNNAGNLNINGTNYGFTATAGLAANQKKLLSSRSINVPHNADGTKSFTITGWFDVNISWGGTPINRISVSAPCNLNTISRPFTFTTNAYEQVFDSPVTVNVAQNNSGLAANLYIHFGNKKILLRSSVPIGSNFTVTVPGLELADQIPGSLVGVGTFYLETVQGSTVVGSNGVSVRLEIPKNSTYQPTLSGVTMLDTVPEIIAITGTNTVFIQGRSALELQATGTGKAGATIVNYKLTIGAVSQTTTLLPAIFPFSVFDFGSGSLTATVTVTDSRGLQATFSAPIVIYSYQPPQILSVTTARNTVTTSTIEVTKTISVSSIKVNNVEKNTYTLVTETKLRSASTWTVAKTETNTSANFNLTGYAVDKSYDSFNID